MTVESQNVFGKIKPAQFDSRVFSIPETDVVNYFLARQQDWTRNSIQMMARSFYSSKECKNKNNGKLQEMIFQKGKNWNDLDTYLKRGRCVVKKEFELTCPKIIRAKWVVDNEIPIFSQDREYISKYLGVEE